MHLLRRTVRFSLPLPDDRAATDPFAEPRRNPYAGWPTARGICVTGELDVDVAGEPDPQSGYLLDITVLDTLVRERVLPWLAERCAEQFRALQPIEPVSLLPEIAGRVTEGLARHPRAACVRVAWRPTPFTTFAFLADAPDMPDHVLIAQTFEFSASHRLHCPDLDDATNRALFGKCNNPNGHGHNYRIEVEVAVPLGDPPAFGLSDLERIVDETVVRRFDHKHLNADCPEFATLNPSVEHIVKVSYDLLDPRFREAGGRLRRVTVWETEKTRATYPA